MILALLLACQPEPTSMHISRMAGHGAAVGGFSLALRGGDGAALGDLEVEVYTRSGGGGWTEVSVLERGAADRLELALVADNSGSEEGYLAPMQEAVLGFGLAALGAGEGGRVGLVRVSTQSEVALPLTDDPEQWREATEELFIANGWTALWDGVRLGNEVLEQGAAVSAAGGLEVCLAQPRRSVVVFTDGQENNSADQQETSYEGDGIDTELADLVSLQVLGMRTPVHSLGIGHEVDDEALRLLAEGSGGSYGEVDDYAALALSLEETVDSLHEEVPVCFEAASCEDDEARILASSDGESWEVVLGLPSLCGCTRTIGYWKTHEEDWPLSTLRLGDREYAAAESLALLEAATAGDKSLSLAQQLIAARLNVAAGAVDDEIAASVEAADAWIAAHDDGAGLPFGTRSWDGGEEVKDALDDWNNGLSGPGHCD